MAQNGNAVISMRVRTLCTQRHSLANHPRRHGGGGGGQGRGESGGEERRGGGGSGVAIRTYVEQVQQHR